MVNGLANNAEMDDSGNCDATVVLLKRGNPGAVPHCGAAPVPPAPQGVPARETSPPLPPIGCVREHPGDGWPLEAVEVLGPNVLRLLTEKQDSKGDARGVKVLTLPFWLCDLGASYLTSMSLIFSSVK